MILLSAAIVVSLLIMIVLPIGTGFWLKKRAGVSWRVMMYGALAYFITQSLVTLLYSGFAALVENGTLALSDQAFLIWQVVLSVLLGAVLGVLVRWAGMKYVNEELDTREAAFGIGVAYGGIESIMMVGLPLLTTFISMVGNINIDPQTTTLDPEIAAQIEQLWQVNPFIPLAGSLERLSAIVMHITVTILVLQVFKRKKPIWLAAAISLELVVNGFVIGLSEIGLDYGWVILVAVVLMGGNLYLLYLLGAFNLGMNKDQEKVVVEYNTGG